MLSKVVVVRKYYYVVKLFEGSVYLQNLGNLKRVVNFGSSLFLYQLKHINTLPLEMGLNSRYFHKKVLNVIRIYKLLCYFIWWSNEQR